MRGGLLPKLCYVALLESTRLSRCSKINPLERPFRKWSKSELPVESTRELTFKVAWIPGTILLLPGHTPFAENAFSQRAARDHPAQIQRFSLTKLRMSSWKFHSISEPSSRLAGRVTLLIPGFWSYKIVGRTDAMENRLKHETWRMGVESPL